MNNHNKYTILRLLNHLQNDVEIFAKDRIALFCTYLEPLELKMFLSDEKCAQEP